MRRDNCILTIQIYLGTMLIDFSGQDLIGCITEPVDFVAGGTCEEQLMGMCETLWEPKMKPDQLFECISQVLLHVYDFDNGATATFQKCPLFLQIGPTCFIVYCAGGDERDGQRRNLWLGSCRPHR